MDGEAVGRRDRRGVMGMGRGERWGWGEGRDGWRGCGEDVEVCVCALGQGDFWNGFWFSLIYEIVDTCYISKQSSLSSSCCFARRGQGPVCEGVRKGKRLRRRLVRVL